ncbi:MAG: hypothetical protein LBR19_02100, partial [Bifidobacteriaceae bacterium]|nr:hypothetical protein [Bifidobacteriaceae bacterium]
MSAGRWPQALRRWLWVDGGARPEVADAVRAAFATLAGESPDGRELIEANAATAAWADPASYDLLVTTPAGDEYPALGVAALVAGRPYLSYRTGTPEAVLHAARDEHAAVLIAPAARTQDWVDAFRLLQADLPAADYWYIRGVLRRL